MKRRIGYECKGVSGFTRASVCCPLSSCAGPNVGIPPQGGGGV